MHIHKRNSCSLIYQIISCVNKAHIYLSKKIKAHIHNGAVTIFKMEYNRFIQLLTSDCRKKIVVQDTAMCYMSDMALLIITIKKTF